MLDRLLDRSFRRNDRLNRAAGDELDRVENIDVVRIADRDHQRLAELAHGNDVELAGDIVRNQLDDIGIELQIGQTNSADIELLADKRGHFLFIGHRSYLDQNLLQPPFPFFNKRERLRQLIAADLARIDEHRP